MSKRITILIGGITAEAALYDDQAPRTVAALWERLPIVDRTIHVAWSGSAFRTEGNHELQPAGAPVENSRNDLEPGDIIFYPGHKQNLIKVGFCYGEAHWLAPFGEKIDVALIGKIDRNFAEFERVAQRILADGPLTFWVDRIAGTSG